MQFNNPIPFSEAIDYQAVKELLPTVLSSKELMRLPVSIRERSFFAAKVMDARFLQKGANLCDDILNPHSVTRADGTSAIEGMSMSKARALLKEYQDSIGYTAPEGKAGTIEDLSSDARLNLIVKMNVGFAQGYGQWKQGQSPAVLDEFPCQELYRREDRMEPRDWESRWSEAGGEFYPGDSDYPSGRMIARKDDPIWEDISAFGIPYPPFDYNSGMDVMDVSRDEALELGVITEDEDSPDPDEDSDFNDDLETSVEDLEDFLQKPLAESVGPAFELTPDGILKFLMEENEDYEPGELEEESLAAKLAGGEEANEAANESDYQCMMLEMPADVAEAMQEFSAQIPEETLTPEAANEASRFVGSNFSVPLAKYAVGWDESIKPALATARAKAVTGATDPAERDSIEKRHGAFIGSCGHTISMCQCGKCGGPSIPVAAPCRQCAEAAANEIEEFSHVTAIWGLDGVPAAEIEAALAELSPDPIQATLGKVTRFSGSRQGTDNADVLVIAVESPDLVALHDALVERFSDRLAPQTHNFNPHSTLAYVLPGTNMDLDGDTSFEGWPVTFSAAVLAGQGSRSRMQIGAEATANEADFDESKHPRDAGGKFATEPGSSGPSPALTPQSGYVSTQVLDDLPEKELRELDTIEQQYPPTDQGGIDTCHRQSDGNEEHPHYTAERLLLHNKIVSEIRANAPAQATPEFLLMGGGTAAGKSTVIQAGKIMLPDRPVMIDSDAIKANLPEYQAMVNNGDTRAAGYCHSESSDIAKRTMNESFVGKQNVVLDGTGNSSSAGVELKCALARAAGFKVRAEYVTCSVDEAIRRATDRAKETGRMVVETQIRNLHRHVSQIFPEAVKKGLFDEAHLWDTEGNSPVLVASVKGTELTVHDDKAWARFLSKGGMTTANEFEETQHPRDEKGEFTSTGAITKPAENYSEIDLDMRKQVGHIPTMITNLPDKPAAPLKGRGFKREILPDTAEHLFEAVPEAHRAEISEKTGNGFGPLVWHKAVSPEAFSALKPQIDEAENAATVQRKAIVDAPHIEFQSMTKHGGDASLETLLPDGRWVKEDMDKVDKREYGTVRAKIGSVFRASGGTWDGENQQSVAGSWMSAVVRVGDKPTLVHFGPEYSKEIEKKYVAGFRPVQAVSMDVATIHSDHAPVMDQKGIGSDEFLASYPAGTKFAEYDVHADKARYPHELKTGSDGTSLIWEGYDHRLYADEPMHFDDQGGDWHSTIESQGSTYTGFRHGVFAGSLAANKTFHLEHGDKLGDNDIVSRLPPESAAKIQEAQRVKEENLYKSMELQAAAERDRAARNASRIASELKEIPGVKISRETEKAWLVKHPSGDEQWFPKSQTKRDGEKFLATPWILGQKGWQ